MNPSTVQAFSAVQAKVPPTSGLFFNTSDTPKRETTWKTFAGIAAIATATATSGIVFPEHHTIAAVTVVSAANTHSQLRRSLAEFDTSAVDFDMANQISMKNMQSIVFLSWLGKTVREIYGQSARMVLSTITDPDTNEPLIEATVFSGLSVGEEFDRKDNELFERIAASGLQDGMQNVVVSQG